jgi:predicted O-methyltransferase YrrM
MSSSYKSNVNFGDIISSVTFGLNPKKIVEFGILNGFSLENFVKASNTDCKIEAYDIFEDFNGNHAEYDKINTMFNKNKNLKIKKGDFYELLDNFEDNSVDIIHIDIANTGDTYKYAIDNYMNKLTKNGLMLLEGGSDARDNVYWMKKYNKTKIVPVLEEYKKDYNIMVIDNINDKTDTNNSSHFGCITLIKK